MPKIILCSPRGFCSGVVRAIDTVKVALEKWGPPIYVKHEIVHNAHVVSSLRERGVIFVEDLSEVPEGEKVIFSAHGVPPSVRKEAELRSLFAIDATCSLVTKVHSAVKQYAAKGYKIVLIGHKNHVEIIGIKGEAPESVFVVETVQDVDFLAFSNSDKLFYITQTTLSLDDVAAITKRLIERYPSIITLPSSSICYATTNRQQALRSVLPKVQFAIIIGDKTSSNSTRLYEIAVRRDVPAAFINDSSEISLDMVNHGGDVVVTSGASTPEKVVQDCIKELLRLNPAFELEEDLFVRENVSFGLPRELDKLPASK
ncbi:4-hydroxy-3-methylbut-2-enyl diphosphate reductase [Chlamydiifrater phoenicopteri]|uniref:4-hydroxy-3-methylbut-2-enyl diphosphate reductase n=1 Tax=Chlamydiifrater phoenicopteri TaxID=2681469 RepID=UPI001BCD6934|nr:4-hydroxy-3-methylbut-2-enyl diphosphate reductase [Chlamydiifrater phoenicopteri]